MISCSKCVQLWCKVTGEYWLQRKENSSKSFFYHQNSREKINCVLTLTLKARCGTTLWVRDTQRKINGIQIRNIFWHRALVCLRMPPNRYAGIVLPHQSNNSLSPLPYAIVLPLAIGQKQNGTEEPHWTQMQCLLNNFALGALLVCFWNAESCRFE